MDEICYVVQDTEMTAAVFIDLVQRVWPGEYDEQLVAQALTKTLNITAWHGEMLVGCVRVLSDGYLFGTVPEILVDPAFQKKGIGHHLMDMAFDHSPTSLFLGARPGNEPFFEKAGYTRSMQSFTRKKPRPRSVTLN